MNNPDHISESLETNFLGSKILKFFDADPGYGMEKTSYPGSGMEKIRSGVADPGCLSRIRNTGEYLNCTKKHTKKSPED